MTAVIEELVDATALRAEATPVLFHGGIRLDLGQLTCVQSGDLLHGYDITRTAGAPWPIDPRRAALVLSGYTVNPHTISPETSYDSTATYRLSLGAAGH
jgi:hypothetical protein